MKKRVLVGMSGGVDSSCAALMLLEQGYEVEGVTLDLWHHGCENQDQLDVANVCQKLGIPHRVVEKTAFFREAVVDYFVTAYLSGKTPNPCVMCNRVVKFGLMLDLAQEQGFDFLATGHYACVKQEADGPRLYRGDDPNKSQEYFMSMVKRERFARTIFPLAHENKEGLKQRLASLNLLREKGESQEVCFIKDTQSPYEFIAQYTGQDLDDHDGVLCDVNGQVLKQLERPVHSYTVGQRRGLNYSAGDPVYVVEVNVREQRVTIGTRAEACKSKFKVGEINWLLPAITNPFSADVKVRYRQKASSATVTPFPDNTAEIEFDEPQFAVAPGQLAVLYDDSLVLGSAFIV